VRGVTALRAQSFDIRLDWTRASGTALPFLTILGGSNGDRGGMCGLRKVFKTRTTYGEKCDFSMLANLSGFGTVLAEQGKYEQTEEICWQAIRPRRYLAKSTLTR